MEDSDDRTAAAPVPTLILDNDPVAQTDEDMATRADPFWNQKVFHSCIRW